MDERHKNVFGRQSIDVMMPPCDGSPSLLSSLTRAQSEAQAFDLLGRLVYYLLGDTRRHVAIKAENGQIKIGVSSCDAGHVSVLHRTIDPQMAKPVNYTPSLCRDMGGAALQTIDEAIHKAELNAAQFNS